MVGHEIVIGITFECINPHPTTDVWKEGEFERGPKLEVPIFIGTGDGPHLEEWLKLLVCALGVGDKQRTWRQNTGRFTVPSLRKLFIDIHNNRILIALTLNRVPVGQ